MTGPEPAGEGTDAQARRDFVVRRCEELLGVELTFPFGPQPGVFKVGGRIFALLDLEGEPGFVSLKCDPEYAAALRTEHDGIRPGYHLDKRHWISVDFAAELPDGLLEELLLDSYHLVVRGLPRSRRPLGRARALPDPGSPDPGNPDRGNPDRGNPDREGPDPG